MPRIPIVPSIAPFAATSDAWISDIWGVLHNGLAAFPAACRAAERFRHGGGTVVLLTNAPRPHGAVQAQLDSLGVPRDCYDAIVTSGDLTRRLISEASGARMFHVGSDRHRVVFDGLTVNFVPEEEAEIFLCTGLRDDDNETPDDYRPLIERLVARKVPMICANPDIKVERGERLVYCAGALALVYETLGGAVTWAGKPYAPAYAMALEAIATARGGRPANERILAIGDGVRTDMAGAAAAGLRSVFIASALHVEGPLTDAKLAQLFETAETRPIAAQQALTW